MSFDTRALDFTFMLGEGQFGDSGENTVKVTGLRAQCRITIAGGNSMGQAQVTVYGMTISTMNALSTLGLAVQNQRRNTLVISAQTGEGVPAIVFTGTIQDGYVDLASAPEVAFRANAYAGLLEAVKPAPPRSYSGPADVAVIMESLATQMGFKFENNGVSAILSNPYFYGSPRNQVKSAANAANINWLIENETLVIWQKGAARNIQTFIVSKDTGMVGYPSYTSKGIEVTAVFNPAAVYGAPILVQDSVLGAPANGKWIIYAIDYDLDSQVPGGKWFTTLKAIRPGLLVVE